MIKKPSDYHGCGVENAVDEEESTGAMFRRLSNDIRKQEQENYKDLERVNDVVESLCGIPRASLTHSAARAASRINIMTLGLALPATLPLYVYAHYVALDKLASSTGEKSVSRVLRATVATGGAELFPCVGFFMSRAVKKGCDEQSVHSPLLEDDGCSGYAPNLNPSS